ncbi:MAG TPA: RDD family protein [Ktedonobacterales bacterium]
MSTLPPDISTAPRERLIGAGLGPRARAFGVDYLVIAGYLILLTGGARLLQRSPLQRVFAVLYRAPASAQLTDTVLFDAPVMLYFALFEASSWQATPGKRRLGLQVVTEEGGRARVAQAIARIVLKFLPWEVAHTSLRRTPGWPRHAQPTAANYADYVFVYMLAGAYLASLVTSDSRQTLYDRLTRTRVIVAPRLAQASRLLRA